MRLRIVDWARLGKEQQDISGDDRPGRPNIQRDVSEEKGHFANEESLFRFLIYRKTNDEYGNPMASRQMEHKMRRAGHIEQVERAT